MQSSTPQPPSSVVLQLVLNVWVTQAAATFASLKFADALADGPQSADVVAERAGTNPDATYRLLRALSTTGIVETVGDRGFALMPVGQCLRSDVPGSMRSFLIAQTAPGHWLSWGQMSHSVRGGTPATTKALGTSIWEYYAAHPEEAGHFAEGMTGLSSMVTQAVLDRYPFADAKTVVDVGGSHGSVLAAVLRTVPTARGILFDRPDVVSGAKPTLDAAGVTSRVECRGGNFFEAVPSGGDVYLLKFILHDWSDQECIQILTACRTAMAPEGRLVVIELMIDGQGPPSPAPLMDLNMMVMLTGRERTRDEYANLFEKAGLSLTQVVPTASPFVVIEARPN